MSVGVTVGGMEADEALKGKRRRGRRRSQTASQVSVQFRSHFRSRRHHPEMSVLEVVDQNHWRSRRFGCPSRKVRRER
jgi:hypothetical protein